MSPKNPLVPLLFVVLLAPTALAQRAPNFSRSLSTSLGAEGRMLWVDATANIFRTVTVNGKRQRIPYASTIEGVRDIVRRSKAAHLNSLVIDVKPLIGHTVYPSKFAPRLRKWQGLDIPDLDILKAFVEEGHKAGLRIYASFNVLSEGHKYYSEGLAYQNPEWQSVVYTINRGVSAVNGARLSFRAPNEPDDAEKPLLLAGERATAGSGIGRIGLDRAEEEGGTPKTVPFGQKLYVTFDENNDVTGMVDGALLGDDPLFAPEDGRMIAVSRAEDRAWLAKNVQSGDRVVFDMKTQLTRIADAKSEKIACFVNPLHPEARRHQLDLIREVITNYEVDGVALDRCRFSNLYNDFSDTSRRAFERRIGKAVNRWPEDIFAFSSKPGKPIVPGALYKEWLAFRAQTIRDLVAEIAQMVRGLKPDISLGAYVGAWYPTYYEVGVNWGSEKTNLRYSWFTPEYPETGYAEFMDWIALGSYHPIATKEDARKLGRNPAASVEGLTEIGAAAVANGTLVFGSIYVPDYLGRPKAMIHALEAASRQGQGWMIFDLTYIQEFDFWSTLEQGVRGVVPAPEALRNLLPTVRGVMDSVR